MDLMAKRYPKIILATQSKARRKLMEELGVPFECHVSGYEENMDEHENPRILAKHLAEGKAAYIAHKFPDSFIIGADTFITIDGEKIGKPADVKEAETIIRKMSGKTIRVHSGIAVIRTDAAGKIEKKLVEYVLTKLKIKKMSLKEIHSLAHHEEALQISGAFSIEGEGGKMVEKIEGDYNNVIGLPLFRLRKMLELLKVIG
jgi:septum formation protein